MPWQGADLCKGAGGQTSADGVLQPHPDECLKWLDTETLLCLCR